MIHVEPFQGWTFRCFVDGDFGDEYDLLVCLRDVGEGVCKLGPMHGSITTALRRELEQVCRDLGFSKAVWDRSNGRHVEREL